VEGSFERVEVLLRQAKFPLLTSGAGGGALAKASPIVMLVLSSIRPSTGG